jgi:hypothetical protein
MASITSANSVLMLSVSSLYVVPQQIQGFAADDIFDLDALEVAETMMGVDGRLSSGYVNVPVKWGISLMADSPSNAIFDNWYVSQKQQQDVYFANGSITLPSLGVVYTLTKGSLTSYQPGPNAKKVLQPRKHVITWESILPSPVPGV